MRPLRNSQFKIKPGEIQIWHSSIKALVQSISKDQIGATLSAEELEGLSRRTFVHVHNEFLAARFLIRNLLSHYRPDVQPSAWKFETNEYGKPTVDCRLGAEKLEFNISHSGDVILCAFSLGTPVGIDVEHRDRKVSWLEMARDSFSLKEAKELSNLPEPEMPGRFFDIWCLKEAFIKAVGMGLSYPLGDFSFQVRDRSQIGIEFAEHVQDDPSLWQFRLFELVQGYQCALAIKPGNGRAVSILQMGEFLLPQADRRAA